jgi:hypothetical protein
MAKSIKISKQSTVRIPRTGAHKIVVAAVDAVDMPSEIFVKQRFRNFARDAFEDNFVAVCSPTQLEDLPLNAPEGRSSYFRVSQVELIANTPELLERIFDSLLYEAQKLVVDLTAIDSLEAAEVYSITAREVKLD